MKKLSLILGSLLLAATASAKEVVAAPVVVEEVVVEEPVVVEVPEFKASGYFKMENEYRGDSEKHTSNKNYMRTEVKTGIKFTENDRIDIRTRQYDDFDSEDTDSAEEMRMRYDHNFGYIGDSKVKLGSRLQAKQYESGAKGDNYTAGMMFDFVEYAPKTDNFAFSTLMFMPKVMYAHADGKNSDANGTGFEFYSYAGQDTKNFGRFEYEFNVYTTYVDGEHNGFDPDDGVMNYDGTTKTYSSGTYTEIEAYIYHAYPLWSSEDKTYKFEFYHEGGVDPIHFGSNSDNKDDSTIYYEPRFRLHQKINAATKFIYAAGGYYANRESTDWDHTAGYEWEPRVSFTIAVNF